MLSLPANITPFSVQAAGILLILLQNHVNLACSGETVGPETFYDSVSSGS